MAVYFASDHAGYELKEMIIEYVYHLGHDIYDFGASHYVKDDDYPVIISKLAEAMSLEIADGVNDNVGIIFGLSGQGEAIVANRFEGIRAIVYYGGRSDIVTKGRLHNDANVLSIGAGFVKIDEAKRAVYDFLKTQFKNEERHVRRLNQIDNLFYEDNTGDTY